MNCGRGPDRAIVIIREMRAVTDAPLIAYPNAGLPITKGDIDDLRARARGHGQGLPGAAGRRLQHRRRLLRLRPRAHPPHRRGRALPPQQVSAALDVRSPLPAVLEDVPLRVDRDEVLRFQGYKKGIDVPDAAVLSLFDEALALGESLMEPRVVYRGRPVTGQGPGSIEAGGERLHIPEIGRLWGPLEQVGAGVCTVGAAIEDRVRRLWDERELPLAVMLDSVGSAAVESLAEYANDLLCQAAIPAAGQGDEPDQPGLRGLGHRRAGRALPSLPRRSDRRHAQRVLRHDAGQEHLFPGRRRTRGARGPLLHPVPALLDARLRLPSRPRRRHGAPVGLARPW